MSARIVVHISTLRLPLPLRWLLRLDWNGAVVDGFVIFLAGKEVGVFMANAGRLVFGVSWCVEILDSVASTVRTARANLAGTTKVMGPVGNELGSW